MTSPDTTGVPMLPGPVGRIVIAAWLTPTVYDIGLGTNHGNRWRLLVAAAIAASTLVGPVVGAPGTRLTIGLLTWIAVTMHWLGIAFLIATVLRTPGCEMRSLLPVAASAQGASHRG